MQMLCNLLLNATAHTGVANLDVDPGVLAQVIGAAGNYQGDFNAVIRQMSRVNIGLWDIEALAAPSLTSGSLFLRKGAEGTVPGSSYISLAGTTGEVFFVPQSITWQAGGLATLVLQAIFLSSDGVAAPITIGTTAGATTAVSKTFSCNNPCIESVTINFGYRVDVCNDGLLYASKVYILEQRPTLSYVTSNDESLATADFNPGTVEEVSVVFAEVAEGGVRGDTLTFALTGHVTRRLSGDRPTKMTVSVQGKGGFTIS